MLASSILSTGQPAGPPPPEPLHATVTVTASVAAEAVAHTTVWDQSRLDALPGVNLDDRLRMLPGFTLFRRTSSLVANPTTQGVSLRGLGSTGASRTLLLWDGVPANSPFGGWVSWTRLDPELISRVEVTRGAPTSAFGDKSMGGAIHLVSREPAARAAWLGHEGGNYQTHQASAGAERQLAAGWAAGLSLRALHTDGFFVAPAGARGPIDEPANVRFAAGALRLSRSSGSRRLFLRADGLGEERNNGTVLTRNSTSAGTAAANWWQQAGSSAFNVVAWHTREEYRATFSAVGAGRQTERLTSRQSVPADATGGSALWQRSARRWSLLAGGDAVRAWGESRETLYPAGFRAGGGSQTQHGIFAHSAFNAGPLRLTAGLRRHDPGAAPAFWMPAAGLAAGRERWRVRAAAYRALRAPTLNELYREFRAGNVVTLANAALKPESLRGVEASIAWRRAAWFAEAAWLMADARFASGERIPQTPRHQGSFLAGWQSGGTSVTAGLRASASQFEDDRNLFLLPGFAVWQATARRQLAAGVEIHFAVENAANREVIAGYSPAPLLGSPRLWRLGIRWRLR